MEIIVKNPYFLMLQKYSTPNAEVSVSISWEIGRKKNSASSPVFFQNQPHHIYLNRNKQCLFPFWNNSIFHFLPMHSFLSQDIGNAYKRKKVVYFYNYKYISTSILC